mmetsp:Transcript_24871/g.33303  ORF Transcript_24871/g.33303 Transcript_24871/m.33303 type:complete len:94 (-) Transcript_24871:95-376(-)
MDDEGVYMSTNVLTIQQNDDIPASVSPKGNQPRKPPMGMQRNVSDPPFDSQEHFMKDTNGKNLRVETEVTGDVHYGTGPQVGIKDKMKAEAAA